MIKNKIVKKITPFLSISNPLINENEGTIEKMESGGGPLSSLLARLWQTLVIVGGLLVILYFVWGAVDWITSNGDQEKLKKARNKIMDAIVGLAILTASYAVIKFMNVIFGFDLTNFAWPTP